MVVVFGWDARAVVDDIERLEAVVLEAYLCMGHIEGLRAPKLCWRGRVCDEGKEERRTNGCRASIEAVLDKFLYGGL